MERGQLTQWKRRLDDYYWLHNVLRSHSSLRYWVIVQSSGQPLRWLSISEEADRVQPFHFEVRFGRESARDEYLLSSLRRASHEGGLIVGELFGFCDLFVPLQVAPRGGAFFYAGQFLREPLDWEGLGDRWEALAGKKPAAGDVEFERFARMALALPIVEAELLPGIERLARLFARYVSGTVTTPSASVEARAIRRAYFLPDYPDQRWMRHATDPEKLGLAPWSLEGGLSEWMREEMGLTRLPTTALALMPVLPSALANDPIRALIATRRVQRACRRWARALPETAADALEDYGVCFLTSPTPGRRPARQRSELAALVHRIQRQVRDEFGWPSVVGIGQNRAPGEALHYTRNEAVVALHLAIQLRREQVFFGNEYDTGQVLTSRDVHDAGVALIEAVQRGTAREAQLAHRPVCRCCFVCGQRAYRGDPQPPHDDGLSHR